MQNPNEDTQWNDTLRKFNILPAKEKEAEITEEDLVKMIDNTVLERTSTKKAFEDMTLEEIEACEDDEDERIIQEYRNKRLVEMKLASSKPSYGEVLEITGEDYIKEINEAGREVWVVLHLYQRGSQLCALINQHLSLLAQKFPLTKFVKSIATLCVRNYPDKNVPTVFVYYEGKLKQQIVGSESFGGTNLTAEGLEWILSKTGAIRTNLEAPPKKEIQDVLFSSLRSGAEGNGTTDNIDHENDW